LNAILFKATAFIVSPDGKNGYALSEGNNAVTLFNRNTTTGEISGIGGAGGCWSSDVTTGCSVGRALGNAYFNTITADGKYLFVASFTGDSITSFERDEITGEIAQRTGTLGCTSNGGVGSQCQVGRALDGALHLVLSPDGKSLYAVGTDSDSVTSFRVAD
jgi:6-phosphogluconolactonase (cycloisomerase 2 family)